MLKKKSVLGALRSKMAEVGKAGKWGEISAYQEVFRTIIHLLVPFYPWSFAGDKCQGRRREEIHDTAYCR